MNRKNKKNRFRDLDLFGKVLVITAITLVVVIALTFVIGSIFSEDYESDNYGGGIIVILFFIIYPIYLSVITGIGIWWKKRNSSEMV
ncbi:hypothetical protein M3610_10545 [Neobacillus sp. MER 74]|uniref:hypothetical protein n=1 Tax=Neobacillus sp. MER 74 TaxID=2939566 RepID=UPI00203A9C0E|nr:hypothetical protein [Neobacillus sp. MER 74]MCM3115727.1 hypothetical protein [Neobacillus sp. MER 74]